MSLQRLKNALFARGFFVWKVRLGSPQPGSYLVGWNILLLPLHRELVCRTSHYPPRLVFLLLYTTTSGCCCGVLLDCSSVGTSVVLCCLGCS